MMAQVFDIAVLGATAAGYAAAITLARRKCTVAIIEAPSHAAECPLSDWVPKDFSKLPILPKGLAAKGALHEFSRVLYHSSDLKRSVEYVSRTPLGYFVNQQALGHALKSTAVKAGVKIRASKTHVAIGLAEDHVTLTGPAHPLTAKLLVLAYGRPNDVISDLSLPVQNVPHPPMVAAALDIPLGPKARSMAGTLHVAEMRERSDLGMFFISDSQLHIRVISASVASGTRAEELSSLVSKLQRAGIVPADLPLAKARGAVWYPPAGMALELETHVAKRCLLVGTAGGFAESITGQTLYPGVKSAMIAAEIGADALAHKKTQEELSRFKTTWRKNMADYLRPPNTSLQMLLPLLFVNQQIVSKFTKALLYGEPI